MTQALSKVRLAILLLSLLASPCVLAGPLADVDIDAASVQWSPLASTHGLKLVVTGPGGFHHQEIFDAASPILFPLGPDLADGHYDYELISLAPARQTQGDAVSQAPRLRQSGVFTIKEGAGVTTSRPEQRPTKDTVHGDDVIVRAGFCVGTECEDGEVFGDDTARLEAPILRLHFDDASSDPAFPSNDWRLVANDSNSGGGDYFAIEDSTAAKQVFRVDAGAPANALRVDSTGEVGLGTATPLANLHIVGGDSPALRLELDESMGPEAQVYDFEVDEEGFTVHDITGAEQPFHISAGANSDSLTIEPDGKVGLGTDSPTTDLHVRRGGKPFDPANAGVVALFQNNAFEGDASIISLLSGSSGQTQIFMGNKDDENSGRILYNNAHRFMRFDTNGTSVLRIDSTGSLCLGCNDVVVGADFVVGDINDAPASFIDAGEVTFTVTSSRTYKENLDAVEATDILEKIEDVDVYTYDFIDGPKDRLGLMAEDFHGIFGRGSEKQINGQEVQMAMWLAIQELTARVKELESQLETVDD